MASSTNQLLKPVTTKRNSAGNIEIGGCDAVELVQKYDTPLYVIDEATLRSICKDYKKAFIYGLCAGSASAFSAKLATKEEIDSLYKSFSFDRIENL